MRTPGTVMHTCYDIVKCKVAIKNIIQCKQPPQIPNCSTTIFIAQVYYRTECRQGSFSQTHQGTFPSHWELQKENKESFIYISHHSHMYPWPHTGHPLSFRFCCQRLPNPWTIPDLPQLQSAHTPQTWHLRCFMENKSTHASFLSLLLWKFPSKLHHSHHTYYLGTSRALAISLGKKKNKWMV